LSLLSLKLKSLLLPEGQRIGGVKLVKTESGNKQKSDENGEGAVIESISMQTFQESGFKNGNVKGPQLLLSSDEKDMDSKPPTQFELSEVSCCRSPPIHSPIIRALGADDKNVTDMGEYDN
jgi:hypothetical protein